jgi:isopenicillin N synthase-like dioxygenase
VINKTGRQRHSIPFFTATRSDVKLECLPTCQGPGNPPKYAPISYGEYIAEVNRRNYDFLREK